MKPGATLGEATQVAEATRRTRACQNSLQQGRRDLLLRNLRERWATDAAFRDLQSKPYQPLDISLNTSLDSPPPSATRVHSLSDLPALVSPFTAVRAGTSHSDYNTCGKKCRRSTKAIFECLYLPREIEESRNRAFEPCKALGLRWDPMGLGQVTEQVAR